MKARSFAFVALGVAQGDGGVGRPTGRFDEAGVRCPHPQTTRAGLTSCQRPTASTWSASTPGALEGLVERSGPDQLMRHRPHVDGLR
jgi:hypothetical protein